jgi:hypothetical protein
MIHFNDAEPTCLIEAIGEQVWKDDIIEEYQYIKE